MLLSSLLINIFYHFIFPGFTREIESISEKNLDYSYICSCPFSANSKVIDLLQVCKVLEDSPKRIMSAAILKASLLHPRPNHTKDALYSTTVGGKKSKYFTSFSLVKSEFMYKNNLKIYNAKVNF